MVGTKESVITPASTNSKEPHLKIRLMFSYYSMRRKNILITHPTADDSDVNVTSIFSIVTEFFQHLETRISV
jgi:hypothetical protein